MKKFYRYLKARFPLAPALLFSLLYGFAGISAAGTPDRQWSDIVIVSLLMLLFLLRIRLWDEIKDFDYDSQHHKSRPVQKGLLSLSSIKKISTIILAVEILLQLFLPMAVVIIYLVALFYSWLMFHNFFVRNFEDKSFLLWLLSHQFIFVIYIYFMFSVGASRFFMPADSRDYWIAIALFLPTLIYEIGRKTKHRISDHGYYTNDTYIFRWGELRTFLFLVSLLWLQAVCMFVLGQKFDHLFLVQVLSILTVSFLYITHKHALINTSDKWSMAIGMYGLILLDLYLL